MSIQGTIRIKFQKILYHRLAKNFSDTLGEIPLEDFEPSTLWSFHDCSILLEKLLNDRQREEWMGDLEEFLYKMHDNRYPKWRLHMETLSRTFDFLKSILIVKVNPSPSKSKRPNL